MHKSTTVYLCGYNEADAWTGLIFDSYESALSYCKDNEGMRMYQAHALVRRETMEDITEEING